MNGDRVMKPVTQRRYRHPTLVARVRIGVGVWLLILTVVLYGSGRGDWWGGLLIPAAALNFYLAHRVSRANRATTNSRHAL